MAAIVITEFMDEEAIRGLLGAHDVPYDPALVDRSDELLATVRDVDALIVRNRTRVDAALLERAPKPKAMGRLGGAALDVFARDHRQKAAGKCSPAAPT